MAVLEKHWGPLPAMANAKFPWSDIKRRNVPEGALPYRRNNLLRSDEPLDDRGVHERTIPLIRTAKKITMSMQNAMAALPVSDISAASAWYTKLLGRGPTEAPMPGLLEWEFPGGGWLQVFEKPDRAGGGSVTILEDDIDARVASLQTAHIRIDRENDSDKTSIAVVEDADGNRITFAMPR